MATEATPLLGDGPEPVHKPHARRTVALLSLTILSLAGSSALCTVPLTRLLEDILCRNHYQGSHDGEGDIDEQLCKVDQVQSQLAYLNGILSLLEASVGLVVALPYGVLADRIGRRLVFLLSSVGTILGLVWILVILRFGQQLPISLILVSPAFQVIGGGNAVVLAMTYSMAADAVPDTAKANAFFRMAVSSYVGAVLGSLASARLMQLGSPWIPILISFAVMVMGVSVVIWIPETLQVKQRDARNTETPETKSFIGSVKTHMERSLARLRDAFSMLTSPSAVLILLVFFCQAPVIFGAGQFFVQYVSKRFGWSLAETGYLLSARGITSMFVLLVALPSLTTLVTSPARSFRLTTQKKDLVLARLSALLITVGAALMAANTISVVIAGQIILTLGDGLIALCRSLISTFVDAEHTSTLYTLISMMEIGGVLCTGPAYAALFSKGMALGGFWLGLPYLGLATLGLIVSVVLHLATLPQPYREQAREEAGGVEESPGAGTEEQ